MKLSQQENVPLGTLPAGNFTSWETIGDVWLATLPAGNKMSKVWLAGNFESKPSWLENLQGAIPDHANFTRALFVKKVAISV